MLLVCVHRIISIILEKQDSSLIFNLGRTRVDFQMCFFYVSKEDAFRATRNQEDNSYTAFGTIKKKMEMCCATYGVLQS